MRRWLLAGLLVFAAYANATTYYVAPPPAGSDAFPGTFQQPWATLQFAGSNVVAGDVVEVRAGTYAGMNLARSGAPGLPITFRAYAAETATISTVAPGTPVGINLDSRSNVVIERLRITTGTYGIRVVASSAIVLRGNRISDATNSGILGGFVDDFTIEDNVVTGSVNNAGVLGLATGARWTIRRNILTDNLLGVNLAGDADSGGPGTFTEVVLERNRIRVRDGSTGSGIAFTGVQGARVVNNLVYNVPRFGIFLLGNTVAASFGNTFLHNTVVLLPSARWAFYVQDASTGQFVRNNIFIKPDAVGDSGSIKVSVDSLPGFSSNRNVGVDRYSTFTAVADDFYTLAGWRAQTGQDVSSQLGSLSVFASPATEDFRLAANANAIDAGEPRPEITVDLDGTTRPQGAGWDIGADEYADALFANGFE